ncbi:SRPBCC family protein [Kineococcus sp. SYSU DK004]|uniref:SRPBCC family protein n=1 Tax=Kineococcus sp. SYSU DK004 TaxID=3383125 RepID=UPI003D7E5EAA
MSTDGTTEQDGAGGGAGGLAGEADAVTRRVSAVPGDGAVACTATISRTYPTTLEDLWEACTDAERIARWFAPVSGELRLGGRYQVEGNAGGEVTSCDPPHGYALTWEFGGQTSVVRVELRAEGDGARLTLHHEADVPDPFWAQYGPGATGVGWDLALLGLALHLRSGGERPAEADGFETRPEGRAFLAAASAAWGDAAAAAGVPADEARAAAGRTRAFYTGEEQPG